MCFTTSLILLYYPPFLQPKYLIAASIVLSGFALVPKLILMRSPLSSLLTFLSAQFLAVEVPPAKLCAHLSALLGSILKAA